MSFFQFIPVIGIVQGFFLSIILFSLKNGNKKANTVLGILIISFSLSISRPILPDYNNFFVLLILTFGPLFLFYVLLLTKPGYELKLSNLFHLIPFFSALLLQTIHININSDFFNNYAIKPLYFLKNFHTMGYCLYIIYYIGKYRKSLKERYSNIDKINLSWLMILLYLFIIYFYIISPALLVFLLFDMDWIIEAESYWTPFLVSIYIFFIGFYGIRYHQVFLIPGQNHMTRKVDVKEDSLEKLIRFMEENRPYLEDDLTLGKLSELSHIPDYYLSRIINEKLSKNFFDFVNSYRIEHFNRICLYEENKQKSILELALKSGFYSKSTFNLSYRKLMGKTPSQYRKLYTK